MFVESMTFEEIRRQVDADMLRIARKATYQMGAILKVMRQTNISRFKKYYDYVTPVAKNRWIYGLNAPDSKSKHASMLFLTQFITERGYAALATNIENKCIFYYTSHFFTRYNQRTQSGLIMNRDIMITFLENNNNMAWQPLGTDKDGKQSVFVQFKHGVGLGSLHASLNLIEFRTFITNDMLRGNQIEISKQLEERFELEVAR